MAVYLGAVKSSKRKMTLYRSIGDYVTSRDMSKVYIYKNGVLYDTDRFGKKTTSYRMSKIDLKIKSR
jgi:hypothetical protein